jgi:hypothetical protein
MRPDVTGIFGDAPSAVLVYLRRHARSGLN